MSQHDESVRLRHMLDAARQAVAFVVGRERADLDKDLQLTLALTRLIEIIGEAAKRISPETRDGLPQIPWRARSQEPATGSSTPTSTWTSTSSGKSCPTTLRR